MGYSKPGFLLIAVLALCGWCATATAQVNLGADTAYCDYDALELDAGPGYVSYLWSTAETSQTIDVLSSGLIWVEVFDGTNTYRDSINITIWELPDPNFLGTNVCLGLPTEFDNLTTYTLDSVVTYQWSFDDGDTATGFEPTHVFPTSGVHSITLTATNSTGCFETFVHVVDVFPNPTADAGPDFNINLGDTVQLTGSTAEDSFYWSPASFVSVDTILNPLAFPNFTVDFVLTAVDSNGCLGVDSANVYVNRPPIAENDQVTLQNNQAGVIDVQDNDIDPNDDVLTTTIISGPNNGTATVVNGDSIQYTPNTNFNGRDTITYQICDTGNPPFCAIAQVIIIVTNANPQAIDDTASTESSTEVQIDVLANDVEPNGQDIFVTDIGSPQAGVITDQGDGLLAYQPAELFSGVDSFYYVICDNGIPVLCDTGWVFITVDLKPIDVPNSFSPNGDGVLDLFVIDGIQNYTDNKLTIFSRWGDVLLQVENYQNDWDGRRDFNEDLPEGVYYYMVELGPGRDPVSGYLMLKR